MADNKLAPQSKNMLPWYEQDGPATANPNLMSQGQQFRLNKQLRETEPSVMDPRYAEWEATRNRMERDNIVFDLASSVIPLAGSSARLMGALKVGQAPSASIKPAAGIEKARENNTFVYDRNDVSQGYGRRTGFPQPAGTPSDKLFSNFADEIKTPEMADKFRSDMLARALKNPNQYANDVVNRSVVPFKDDMYLIVDAADKGNTRLQVIKNNAPVAGARLQKGLLDSIAVDESAKGQRIGSDLLQFIHDTKIGNVLEVPDRSPGFVKIQKDLVKKLESTN